MQDDSTVPVLRTFMQEHFNNGVVPRLLGWDTDDGLTTLHPSMDDAQRYTILRELGVVKSDFLSLLQLLRTGDVTEDDWMGARRAALLLGGLDVVDAYVRPTVEPAYNPMSPQEDTRQWFTWKVAVDVNPPEENETGTHTWSATRRTEDPFRYWYRKQIVTDSSHRDEG